MADDRDATLIALTADIVSAHVANNHVSLSDVPLAISHVHEALAALGQEAEPAPAPQIPAVSVRASVKPDYIVCLEDGKKMKMLKRHLMTDHQMTPAEYRAKWKLPAAHPMVAPNYSERRRALAVKIGLGRKPGKAAGTKKGAKPQGAPPK